MKNIPRLHVSTKPSVSLRSVIVSISGGLLLAGSIFGLIKWDLGPENPDLGIKEYYFSPIEDNFYENPTNWMPEYPGTKIEANTKVVIQGLAYITHYDLEILGELQISMDGMLFSSDGNVMIDENGKIFNEGEIVLNQIDNAGELNNQMAASINVHELITQINAMTTNRQSASIVVNKRLLNLGSFDNYGQCSVQLDFDNQAEFNQIRGGELLVKGNEVDPSVIGI